MKKIFILVAVLMSIIMTVQATFMNVEKSDHTIYSYDVDNVDQVTFSDEAEGLSEPDTVKVEIPVEVPTLREVHITDTVYIHDTTIVYVEVESKDKNSNNETNPTILNDAPENESYYQEDNVISKLQKDLEKWKQNFDEYKKRYCSSIIDTLDTSTKDIEETRQEKSSDNAAIETNDDINNDKSEKVGYIGVVQGTLPFIKDTTPLTNLRLGIGNIPLDDTENLISSTSKNGEGNQVNFDYSTIGDIGMPIVVEKTRQETLGDNGNIQMVFAQLQMELGETQKRQAMARIDSIKAARKAKEMEQDSLQNLANQKDTIETKDSINNEIQTKRNNISLLQNFLFPTNNVGVPADMAFSSTGNSDKIELLYAELQMELEEAHRQAAFARIDSIKAARDAKEVEKETIQNKK